MPSFPIGEQAGGTEIETDISAKKLRTLGGPAIPLRCWSHLGKELIGLFALGNTESHTQENSLEEQLEEQFGRTVGRENWKETRWCLRY